MENPLASTSGMFLLEDAAVYINVLDANLNANPRD